MKIFDNRIEFYNPGKLPDSITVEDLLSNNYKSTPRNKLMADFFKSLGLIEKYGSGIQRIVEYLNRWELPQPEFRNISDGFMVTIFSNQKEKKVGGKVGGKVGEKLTENQEKIVCRMQENPHITAQLLSTKVGISVRKIESNIQKLKEYGIIKRVGPAKGGHWKITHK